jgi:hypothetical protein
MDDWERTKKEMRAIGKTVQSFASPIQAYANVYQLVNKAQAFSEQKFDKHFNHNGQGDALKHCYMSALLTQWGGADFAKAFGDAHEDDPTNKPKEKSMDLYNNAIGRAIAKKHHSADSARLGELCVKAVLDGTTAVLEGPGANWPWPWANDLSAALNTPPGR